MERPRRLAFDGACIESQQGENMRTIEDFIVAPKMEDRQLKSFVTQDFQTTIVGMLGHDLRQSLHIIQGTYSLLRSRLEEMPQQAWLDRGERAVTKLTEQLNCLVDAFYLAERTNALEVSSVGLGPLFWRLRHENEDAAIQEGIDLRAITTNAHVVSNPVLLDCILQNLLTNAMRYTEPGGHILIGCRRKGSEIRIDVYDTGIGIPEDQLPRIFESFTRLAPERSNGLGLGLSIVRRALEVLGHRIEVRSIVGEGSLFSIYAPAASTSAS
jgi:two-component system phosphate regulon sensor histidine kinase PhoR